MSGKVPTLIDVAREAGVAVVTASRALNTDGYVAAETRARVLRVAGELGYSPNVQARKLKSGKSSLLGLVVSHIDSPSIARIVANVSRATKMVGLDLVIYNASAEIPQQKQQSISNVLGGICDGLIVALPNVPDGIVSSFKSSLPAVLINYWRVQNEIPVVLCDNFSATKELVAYLISLGHKDIAFVRGSQYTGQDSERFRGYCAALNAAGLKVPADGHFVGNFTREGGYAAARELLSGVKRPTAIVSSNDDMALGVIDYCADHGLSVPMDVSVVGFDNVPEAATCRPRLTTVEQPLGDACRLAVDSLVAAIDRKFSQGTGSTDSPAGALANLPSKVIYRDSCAPPR